MTHLTSSRLLGTALAFMLWLFVQPAMAFKVGSSITGWWEQPDQQSHGLIISTSQLPDGTQRGVVFWAHYDSEGNATWLLGEGPLGSDSINADLYEVGGVAFMQEAGSVPSPEQKIGELVVSFSDCNTGEATYSTSTIGQGSFRVSRLTRLAGLACSGGITDDIPPTIEAQKIEANLIPATGYESADAEAEWLLVPGNAKFEVSIENVAAGEYSVIVDGVEQGTIDVQPDGSDSVPEGDIEFFSPQRGYHPLLNFDPRGKLVQIVSGGITIAAVTFPTESQVIGIEPEEGEGEVELKQRMTNAGTYPQGEAEVKYEAFGSESELEIEIENIPAGDYSVVVDTVSKGTITVVEKPNGDLEGDLEFRSPAEAGYVLLDFEPRGALIEILDGSTAVFYTTFQGTGNGSGNGGGGDDDEGPGDDDGDDDGGGDDDDGGGDDDDGGGDDDDGGGDDGGDDNGDDDNEGNKVTQRYRLDNLTGNSQSSAMTKLETDDEGVEFEVELDRVSSGTYTLKVGGVIRGDIIVGSGDNDGDIDFSNPQEDDDALLDFEVKGQLIEVLQGETVLFSGTFPTS
jgi:hypothetical protein